MTPENKIKIYDTLRGELVDLIPVKEGEIKIYLCGPTVYNLLHIGNARPIIIFDAFRRFLEYLGYKVILVQNFTDIDDKIIEQANREGISFEELAKRYIIEYWKDMVALKARAFNFHPKTTNYVDEIILYIDDLIKKGYAYKADNGDVYFDINKFKRYGELSHRKVEDMKVGNRIEVSQFKKDPLDFALWKVSKEGEPYWESPWSKGRPGWHIECSVMSTELLGETFDIHAGGNDLIFPHHENERAQAMAKTGKEFAKYWMHNGMIKMAQDKMSKSLGNVWYLRDLLKKFDSDVLKIFVLSKHYRIPIDISEDLLRSQQTSVNRVKQALKESEEFFGGKVPYPTQKDFFIDDETFLIEKLSNDFDTPAVISRIFELSKELNKALNLRDEKKIKNIYYIISNFYGSILGLFETSGMIKKNNFELDQLVEVVLNVRDTLRKEKRFDLSDYIRNELINMGIKLKDTPERTKWQ